MSKDKELFKWMLTDFISDLTKHIDCAPVVIEDFEYAVNRFSRRLETYLERYLELKR